jgi:hypothetical protein
MIKMYALFLLLSLSSAACAMGPGPVAMSDDAPSHFSKETHQRCCGACGCAAGTLVLVSCAACFAAISKSSYEKCGNGLGCTDEERAVTIMSLNPMTGISLMASQYVGYKVGSYIGETVTHPLDQRLRALLKKEKSE